MLNFVNTEIHSSSSHHIDERSTHKSVQFLINNSCSIPGSRALSAHLYPVRAFTLPHLCLPYSPPLPVLASSPCVLLPAPVHICHTHPFAPSSPGSAPHLPSSMCSMAACISSSFICVCCTHTPLSPCLQLSLSYPPP